MAGHGGSVLAGARFGGTRGRAGCSAGLLTFTLASALVFACLLLPAASASTVRSEGSRALLARGAAARSGGAYDVSARATADADESARQAADRDTIRRSLLAGAPVRRKLINLQAPQGTKFFHQPLVNCQNYTVANTTAYPSCCTLTAQDCAARCEAIPTCVAFKYAWFMNTQPAASSVPSLPAGQQWTWCMLLDSLVISTCSAVLRWDPSANGTQLRPADIWDTYYKYANGTYPQATTWTTFYNSWGNISASPPPPALPTSEPDVPVIAGLTVGLGVPFCLALGAGVALCLAAYVCGGLPGTGAGRPARRRVNTKRSHDVFLSYRRQDLQVADAVHDKLILAGLRVFYDRSGGMAGRPFEQELFRGIRDSPVFAPVITLDIMAHWAAHDPSTADYTLAEFIVALHYARLGRVQLVFPLLVGEWCERPASTGGGERDYLLSNAKFKTHRDALPAVVPAATLALVASMFKGVANGESLDGVLANATVRDIILGSASMHSGAAAPTPAPAADPEAAAGQLALGGATLRGMLEMDSVMLYGPDEQAGLVLRHRYAESMVAALYGGAASKKK